MKTSPIKSTQLSNRVDNAVLLAVLLAALAVAVLPDPAFAQGQGESLLQYAYDEYGRVALNAGIIGVAIMMFFLRFSFQTIGTVAAGGLTFANYSEIAALFGA